MGEYPIIFIYRLDGGMVGWWGGGVVGWWGGGRKDDMAYQSMGGGGGGDWGLPVSSALYNSFLPPPPMITPMKSTHESVPFKHSVLGYNYIADLC